MHYIISTWFACTYSKWQPSLTSLAPMGGRSTAQPLEHFSWTLESLLCYGRSSLPLLFASKNYGLKHSGVCSRYLPTGLATTKTHAGLHNHSLTSGSFGVAIAIGNQDFWECAGLVNSNPSTVNSKRPELAGYAASLPFDASYFIK